MGIIERLIPGTYQSRCLLTVAATLYSPKPDLVPQLICQDQIFVSQYPQQHNPTRLHTARAVFPGKVQGVVVQASK